MEDRRASTVADSGLIDFDAIVTRLLRGRLAIAFSTLIFALMGVIYLHSATYSYTATLVVIPTQGQSMSGVTGQLGSLASLAGIDIGGQQNVSPFALYPDVMKTRIVGDTFAARYPALMHKLFASEWDQKTGKWQAPGGLIHTIVGGVKSFLGIPSVPWSPPAGGNVQDVVNAQVFALQDSKKPVLTMTFSNKDPVFARQFLQAIHEGTDLVLRRQTLDRSTKYARYLEDKLQNTQQTEIRQVLISSLSQQETLVMMSNSATPFAAQPVGDAVSSLRPTFPHPVTILALAIFLGMGAGAVWVYFGLPLPWWLRPKG